MDKSDPLYAFNYYKAVKLDPFVKEIIPRPTLSTTPRTSNISAPQRTSAPQTMSTRDELKCFGCGEKGHGISYCPSINDLLAKGIIQRDDSGKLE